MCLLFILMMELFMYFQIWNLWYYFLCFLLHFISWYKMVVCNPPISNLPHPQHHYHPIHLLSKLFAVKNCLWGFLSFSFTSMLYTVIAASIHFYHFFDIMRNGFSFFHSFQLTKLSLFTPTTYCMCDGEKTYFLISFILLYPF